MKELLVITLIITFIILVILASLLTNPIVAFSESVTVVVTQTIQIWTGLMDRIKDRIKFGLGVGFRVGVRVRVRVRVRFDSESLSSDLEEVDESSSPPVLLIIDGNCVEWRGREERRGDREGDRGRVSREKDRFVKLRIPSSLATMNLHVPEI
eukprot:694270-Amorphochlora_amoeboformis.AAC.1